MGKHKNILTLSGQIVLVAMGLGFFYAWQFSASPGVQFFNPADTPSFVLGYGVPLVFFIITCTVVFFVAPSPLSHSTKRQLAFVLFFLSFIFAALLPLFPLNSSSICYILYSLISACSAGIIVLWGQIFCHFKERQLGIAVPLSFIFSSTLNLAIPFLSPEPIRSVIPQFYLPGSALLLFVAIRQELKHNEPKTSSQLSKRGHKGFYAVVAALSICLAADEIIRVLYTPIDANSFYEVGSITQLSCLGVALFALGFAVVRRQRYSFRSMLLVIVPLMVAGFMGFFIAPFTRALGPIVLLGTSYWMLHIFLWIAVSVYASKRKAITVKLFSFMEGCIYFAILAAAAIGNSLHTILPDSDTLTLPLSVCVIVVVIASMLLLRSSVLFPKHSNTTKRPRSNSHNDAHITEYHEHPITNEYLALLTDREREVCLLLLKGRNLPIVQKELNISKGTAQTHVRHIYEKFNVHSRQELLDLFDSTSS